MLEVVSIYVRPASPNNSMSSFSVQHLPTIGSLEDKPVSHWNVIRRDTTAHTIGLNLSLRPQHGVNKTQNLRAEDTHRVYGSVMLIVQCHCFRNCWRRLDLLRCLSGLEWRISMGLD